MLLWVGHSGGAQVSELSLHIVMYSAVKWAFEMFKTTSLSGLEPGSAGTGDQSAYLWSLQKGSLTAVELSSWHLRASERVLQQTESENWPFPEIWALKLAQQYFHYILLVKAVPKSAQIQGRGQEPHFSIEGI